MNNLIYIIRDILTNYPLIAPFFAFLGGLIASFSPCSLSSIPLILGYIGKGESKNKTLKLALTFAFGNSFIFVLLGIFSSYLSVMTSIIGKWWYLIIAFILITMVLEMWGVINIINAKEIRKPRKKGYLGAFTTGILSGIVASPCSTPILIILLTIASTKGIVYGAILLLYYALGHNTLAIASVIANNKISAIKKNSKYQKYNKLCNIIFGLIILLVAFYFFYIGI